MIRNSKEYRDWIGSLVDVYYTEKNLQGDVSRKIDFDPDHIPVPLAHNVIVLCEVPDSEFKTASGFRLLKSEETKDYSMYHNCFGRVVDLSESAFSSKITGEGYKVPKVSIGDRVMWSKGEGTMVEVSGVMFKIFSDVQIIAKLAVDAELSMREGL